METLRCMPLKTQSRAQFRMLLVAVSNGKLRPDLVEIWLDAIKNNELAAIGRDMEEVHARTHISFIVTDKSPQEARTIDEKIARFGALFTHMRSMPRTKSRQGTKNALYAIDLDDTTPPRAIKKLRMQMRRTGRQAKIILSHHDNKKTPSAAIIKRRIKCMKQKGADMIKIVTTYKKPSDITALIEATRHKTATQHKVMPTIFHLMGTSPRAKAARVLCAAAGSPIAYVALDSRHVTAPGQWTIAAWDRIVRTQQTK